MAHFPTKENNHLWKIQFDCNSFQVILGKVVKFPATLDEQLQKQLLDCSGEILTAVGDTMCTHDFYEGKINYVFELILQECFRLNLYTIFLVNF